MHLHVRNFAVINSVGAVSLRATLNCDAFAHAHSSESHFDRSSFVGLAVTCIGFERLSTSTMCDLTTLVALSVFAVAAAAGEHLL